MTTVDVTPAFVIVKAEGPSTVTLNCVSRRGAISPKGVVGALATAQSALTQVEAYLGKYTPGVTQTLQSAITKVQSTVNTINQTLAKAQNIISLFPGAPPAATKQAKAYSQLFTAMNQKLPMTIDTPYRILHNMIIKRIAFTQPEETKSWSDITVTLKQINFVEIETVADNGQFSGRLQQQAQASTNKGVVPGASVPTSAAYTLAQQAGWVGR